MKLVYADHENKVHPTTRAKGNNFSFSIIVIATSLFVTDYYGLLRVIAGYCGLLQVIAGYYTQ
ncbi:hypothetical protein [Undibacterium sp. SXout20W]|uniref:hypothetical protein n=1 Tax=Undibacterium sp. SXout20W TaxID=3413051 RepID=UPI003BF6172D